MKKTIVESNCEKKNYWGVYCIHFWGDLFGNIYVWGEKRGNFVWDLTLYNWWLFSFRLDKMEKYSQFLEEENLELVKKIGSGGFGKVFLARETKENINVAVKVYKRSHVSEVYFEKEVR